MSFNVAYANSKRSAAGDEQYTPAYAVVPLIKYLQAKQYKTIWCPFDLSDSAYVTVLQHAGFTVLFSHLAQGQDFFTYEPEQPYDCIVSNPPFSLKDKILKRCYDLNKPFALLLPLPALQSKKRTPWFAQYGLEVLIFDSRIGYYNANTQKQHRGNSFASVYYCHNLLPEKLMFEHLEIA